MRSNGIARGLDLRFAEIGTGGVTGSRFKADDPRALAAAVIHLLEGRESWPGRLEQARRFVEEERSWSASVANYAPLLERLTRKPA